MWPDQGVKLEAENTWCYLWVLGMKHNNPSNILHVIQFYNILCCHSAVTIFQNVNRTIKKENALPIFFISKINSFKNVKACL